MRIDVEKCVGCRACHPYCTVGAIFAVKRDGKPKSEVNQEVCVECGACLRSEICPRDAIILPDLEWPRIVRAQFGNPYFGHPKGAHSAPPAPDMKLNDIHDRMKRGATDVVVEVGRPGVSTSFRDVDTICTALMAAGMEVDAGSPVAAIMEDVGTGKLKADVLGERALNVMIQFRVENDRLGEALTVLRRVSREIDTVFSLSLVNRLEEDGSVPALAIARQSGLSARPHTKTNTGLGRRLPEEN